MDSKLLHVVTAVSNPLQWESRWRLYRDFREHMLDSGVKLTVIECETGDRPFRLHDQDHVNHIGVRCVSRLWEKECLLNIAISRMNESDKYVAWVDADIHFRKNGWARHTVDALQMHKIIQPWSDCYDLGPEDEHMQHHHSFLRQYVKDVPMGVGKGYATAHPGYAWAARRSTLHDLHGLFDVGVLGSGDSHMAWSLIGRLEESLLGVITPGYKRRLIEWQDRATKYVARDVGYLDGHTIEHHFHGRKENRNYLTRWNIIAKHNYNPDTDLRRNLYGVYELAGNKPGLQRDIDRYLRARHEDSNQL